MVKQTSLLISNEGGIFETSEMVRDETVQFPKLITLASHLLEASIEAESSSRKFCEALPRKGVETDFYFHGFLYAGHGCKLAAIYLEV